jgi:hypothetical protein
MRDLDMFKKKLASFSKEMDQANKAVTRLRRQLQADINEANREDFNA